MVSQMVDFRASLLNKNYLRNNSVNFVFCLLFIEELNVKGSVFVLYQATWIV